MKVRYKRDLNSNYMILDNGNPGDENYEIRMITENRIRGLLPCVNQKHDQVTEYFYEITGHQSMGLLYERKKLSCAQLRNLLRELERTLEASKEYLLNPDHFLLDPDMIYIHTQSEKLYLCYFPGYSKDIRESFLDLAEYLLGKIDKNDAQGIEFGYDLYQQALEPNFSLLDVLRNHMEKENDHPDIHLNEREDVVIPEEVMESAGGWKNFFRKKTKKNQQEDYVAEADQMGSGSVLFLREQNSRQAETLCLQNRKREGLYLKSRNPEYPDFEITGTCFLIGKKKDCVDGCLPSATISRLHARITCDGRQYYIEDLNSTNGTWVDQEQLNPYELHPLGEGMKVVFASAEYEVQL